MLIDIVSSDLEENITLSPLTFADDPKTREVANKEGRELR